MFGYDAALKVCDADDGMELAAAVWRGVFKEDEGADTEAVLALADYARREVLAVAQQPREDVYRGWVSWGPAAGEDAAARLARQRRMLEGEWRDALTPTGRLFFYHTASHERRWDAPAEGFYGRRRVALMRHLEAHPACAARLPPLPAPAGAPAAGGGAFKAAAKAAAGAGAARV